MSGIACLQPPPSNMISCIFANLSTDERWEGGKRTSWWFLGRGCWKEGMSIILTTRHSNAQLVYAVADGHAQRRGARPGRLQGESPLPLRLTHFQVAARSSSSSCVVGRILLVLSSSVAVPRIITFPLTPLPSTQPHFPSSAMLSAELPESPLRYVAALSHSIVEGREGAVQHHCIFLQVTALLLLQVFSESPSFSPLSISIASALNPFFTWINPFAHF